MAFRIACKAVLQLAVAGVAASNALGCATYAAENRRLLQGLEESRQADIHQRRHLAALEQRLAELEQDALEERRSSLQQSLVLEKLDLIISQNQQRLLRAAEAADTKPPGSALVPAEGTFAGSAASTSELDPREQLRFWAERLRADSQHFRGGLSPAQHQALNVLLRRERLLDPRNPWYGK
jgi:hypothetical protein